MNLISKVFVIATTLTLLAGAALAAESAKDAKKLTCCQQAKAQAKNCTHNCCITAHRKSESCTRCNPNKEDLVKDEKKVVKKG